MGFPPYRLVIRWYREEVKHFFEASRRSLVRFDYTVV